MPKAPHDSLSALLVRSQQALVLSQTGLGEVLGVSRSTVNRWCGGRTSGLLASQVEALTEALWPVDPDLARAVAAAGGTTPEKLGLVIAAPPTSPEAAPAASASLAPRIALDHLVDSVVCAAAEAIGATPADVRPTLRAAFERAKGVGLSVDDLVTGLGTAPRSSPDAAPPRRSAST